jgi:hypothetical protein
MALALLWWARCVGASLAIACCFGAECWIGILSDIQTFAPCSVIFMGFMIFISYDLQSEWKPLLDSRLPSLPLRTFIVFHYDFKRLMDIEDFHGLRGARLEPWSPPRSTPETRRDQHKTSTKQRIWQRPAETNTKPAQNPVSSEACWVEPLRPLRRWVSQIRIGAFYPSLRPAIFPCRCHIVLLYSIPCGVVI